MQYIGYLHKEADSDYGVSFPDFPGCVTAGTSLEDARQMAGEALALHIQGMMEDGEKLPEPSTLDDIAEDPNMHGAVAVLITPGMPERTVRFNITARQSQLEAIDRRAKRTGMSRSAFLVYAALGSPSAAAEHAAAKYEAGAKEALTPSPVFR